MKDSLLRYRWVVAATLLFWIVLSVTPPLDCDFAYMREMQFEDSREITYDNFYYCNGDLITTPSQWFNSAKNHYLYHDNGRLANFLAMGQAIIPHWAYDLLLTLCYAILVITIIQFAGLRKEKPGVVAAVCLSLWCFLIWSTPMLSIDYLLNYLLAAAVTFRFSWVVTRRDKHFSVGSAVLALIGGLLHEGFSVPVSAALFIWLIVNRKKVTRGQIWLCIIFFVASLFTVISPALLCRFTCNLRSSDANATWLFLQALKAFVRENALLIVGIFVFAYTLVKHPERLRKPIFLIPVVIWCVSTVIFFIVTADTRALWPEQLSVIILFFACLRGRWVDSRILSCSLWAVLTAWSLSLAWWEKKLAAEQDSLDNDTSLIYTRDFTSLNDTPFWLGKIPSGPGTFIGAFEFKTRDTDQRLTSSVRRHAFLPSGFNFDDTTQIIPGNLHARGKFPFFAVPASLTDTTALDLDVVFKLGPADFSKCKNLVVTLRDILNGNLNRSTELELTLARILQTTSEKGESFVIYEPVGWYLGSTYYSRPILAIDATAEVPVQDAANQR